MSGYLKISDEIITFPVKKQIKKRLPGILKSLLKTKKSD
jgi:hypothetical protein